MTEPKRHASSVVPVLPGIVRWSVADDRIGGRSSEAYAVVTTDTVTLVDPLPIEDAALRALGRIDAIILTAGNHQRAAWRFRQAFGVPVYAPRNAYGLEQAPDASYEGGDSLPGGLTAFHTPGPVESMHALWLSHPVSVMFVSDLLTHDGKGGLAFVPGKYQDEPARTRMSVKRLVEQFAPEALLFAHGAPLLEEVKGNVERAFRDDPEHRTQA